MSRYEQREAGPDQPSDAYPLTDRAEIAEARVALGRWLIDELMGWEDGPEFPGPEQFATQEDYQAARELDEWGCNPFEEG